MPELGSRPVRHSRRRVGVIVVAAAVSTTAACSVFDHVNERQHPTACTPGGPTADPDDGERIRVGGCGGGSLLRGSPRRENPSELRYPGE